MNRNIVIYIKDILANMEKAEKFVKDIDHDQFVEDEKTNYAVIRCIEIMGEASKHIPESIRQQYPQIPWRDIAGMRDKVIHFYFGIDIEKVWLVIKEDIPQIKPHIRKVFDDLQSEDNEI